MGAFHRLFDGYSFMRAACRKKINPCDTSHAPKNIDSGKVTGPIGQHHPLCDGLPWKPSVHWFIQLCCLWWAAWAPLTAYLRFLLSFIEMEYAEPSFDTWHPDSDITYIILPCNAQRTSILPPWKKLPCLARLTRRTCKLSRLCCKAQIDSLFVLKSLSCSVSLVSVSGLYLFFSNATLRDWTTNLSAAAKKSSRSKGATSNLASCTPLEFCVTLPRHDIQHRHSRHDFPPPQTRLAQILINVNPINLS